MPDLTGSIPASPSSDELLETLLEVSLTAVNLLRPVYEADSSELIDFALEYINPAGQRMVGLPERPGGTLLSHFPAALPNGVFHFYRQVFETGEAGQHKVNYQADGLDNYFHLAAKRCGSLLVASFTDTADQDRSAVELTLRENQSIAREGLAAVEAQRQQLNELFNQAPACIARLTGPTYIFTLANPLYHQLFGGRELLGKPIREALPELAGEPFFGLLDEAYSSGEPFYGREIPITFDQPGNAPRVRYFNFINQPTRDTAGAIDGILVFAYEVSEVVQARRLMERNEQQLQELNRQLADSNAELEAATRRTEEARAEADLQRQRLHGIFMQAPAMICILEGPEHHFRLVNPDYQQLVGGRPLLGKPIREAMPELVGQPIFGLLDQVYHTGETYYAEEMLVELDHANTGRGLGKNYYNFIYQATRNVSGVVDGIMVFAYEVTAQVNARRQAENSRQQVESLNEELAAANEELAAANEELQSANEEFLSNNAELLRTQRQLQQLNAELESRVQNRTQDLQRAQAATELERQRLEHLFMQAPAAICILDGPDFVFELINPTYQAMFGGRPQPGLPMLTALPELQNHTAWHTLREVYITGHTHFESSILMPLLEPETGLLEDRYFTFIQQARYNEQGSIDGVLVFAFEITEQVQVRQRADALQSEVLASAQRLAQERETFYQLFEQTPAAICVLHEPKHRIEYYNQAYQDLFPGRQMWGRTIAETQPDAVAQGFLTLLDNVYQTGQTFFGNELLLRIDQLDGGPPKETYFNFTYQAYQENGKISGVSIFAYDVTEQVRARQQRDLQRQQLERLFMQAPAAICILNGPDFVFELVNPSYQQMFPDRTLLGKTVLEALPEVADHAIYRTLRGVYQTGVMHEEKALLLPFKRPEDGVLEDRYFNYIYQARYDEHGQIDGVLAFAFEVTDQVQARKDSEASAQQLRLITDSLPVLIGYLDRDQKYQFANQAYEAWFNQRPEDLLGRSVREIVGEKAYQNVHKYIERALAGERFDFEAQMPYRDNFMKHIRTSYVPDVRDGVVLGFYTMVTDITEPMQARQALEEGRQQAQALAQALATTNAELGVANDQLRRTNVDLDNFIYTASHDLKAPITNIEGLLHALQQQLPADTREDDVEFILAMMQGAIERFKTTIDHLTEVSKLQKEHDQPVVSVHLGDVIEGVRLDLLPLLEKAQAQLVVTVDECPTLSFSEKNLRSVVYNLLSNALKYRSPERPAQVHMRCREEANYFVLEVQDNGLGLDLSRERQLFSMFQRYHTHVEGSGIGLYMVKKMVENAGGKIEVKSEIGVGSTFSVFFKK